MIIDRNILVRYFLGQCSKEEKDAIHQWLNDDEAHKKEFIRERICFDASLVVEQKDLQPQPRPISRKKIWSYLQIAAIVLLLIGNIYLFQFYLLQTKESILQDVYVPAGSRTSLTLPDGTLVWLNSNTSFKYPTNFTGKHRSVELNGEAYFEVATNKKKSFIVKTDKYNVEALGTTFNVEAYTHEPAYKTTLYSGKVRVFNEEEEDISIYLKPGEAADLVDGHLQIIPGSSNTSRWKDGLIIMEGESFKEIMHLFEKYFDMEIIIENDKVTEKAYEGKLRIADGIDHALRVLQKDFRFTYHREAENNVIHIH